MRMSRAFQTRKAGKEKILSQIRSIVSDDSMELVNSFFSDLKYYIQGMQNGKKYFQWQKVRVVTL